MHFISRPLAPDLEVESLHLHAAGRPGKIEVIPSKPLHTQRELDARLLTGRGRALPSYPPEPGACLRLHFERQSGGSNFQ